MSESWAPSPAEVKALMPTRVNGMDFSADTIPSVSQVQTIIDDEADDLVSYVGDPIPTEQQRLAKGAAAYFAAAVIEREFYPEQNDPRAENTPAAWYTERGEQRRDRLVKIVGDQRPADERVHLASGHFPSPVPAVELEEFEPIGTLDV